MFSLSTVLTFSLISMLTGLFLGLYLAQRKGLFSQRQAELEKQLSDITKQQQHYQEEVTEHFEKSAQLLNQLTDSYKEVHTHLAEGAHILAGAKASASIKTLGSSDSDSIASEEIDQPLTPPLDYAPVQDGKNGTLSESFGIEKTTIAEERTDTGYPRHTESISS